MDLNFVKYELYQAGYLSKPRTLRVLPPGKNRLQKIVVGDDEGNMTCITFKRNEVTVHSTLNTAYTWNRLDGELIVPRGSQPCLLGASRGRRIRSMWLMEKSCVGSTRRFLKLAAITDQDQGKEVFEYDTALAEPISKLFVEGDHIFTGGDFTFTHYEGTKEKNFYMASGTYLSAEPYLFY